MQLRKAKGNMFRSVNFTATFYQGCSHNCVYCWAKCMGISHEPKMVQTNLLEVLDVENAFIFLNSAHDSFASCIPNEWIKNMLSWIGLQNQSNRFLLQTKNPMRFFGWLDNLLKIKDRVVLGTTVETDNEKYAAELSKAVSPIKRAWALGKMREYGFKTFLSLEPLVRFEDKLMVKIVRVVGPEIVEVGLDNWQSRHGHTLEAPHRQTYKRFRRTLELQGWTFKEKDSISSWLNSSRRIWQNE